MMPKYPIYIVSKGRWQSNYTSKALTLLGVEHYIVVEAHEWDEYAEVVSELVTLLVLNPDYQDQYYTFDDLGDSKSKGPGPARNFAWEHSVDMGFDHHWVMDDNIRGFYRFNNNGMYSITDGTIIRCMEDFADRYSNVSMAGPAYEMFVMRRSKYKPFVLNTRIYSCNLIRNDIRFRWRGRYNEDTDLSLRMLKAGWCTIQFNAFLQHKPATQRVSGGNTREFYEKEGTLPKSEMIVRMHPDVAKLAWRFNRPHHVVKYSGFKQPLVRRPDLVVPDGNNEYGMQHQIKIDGVWVDS